MRDLREPAPALDQRGVTLIELCIALVVLALGLLAIGQVFPAGSRSSTQSRIRTDASLFAQQKLEELNTLSWNDDALSAGRHPAGAACDTLSAGHCLRFYNVDVLPAPLNNLKRVAVTVTWNFMGTRTLTDTTYIRL